MFRSRGQQLERHEEWGSAKYDERVIDLNAQLSFVASSRRQVCGYERTVHGDPNLDPVPCAQRRQRERNAVEALTVNGCCK